MTEQSAEIDHSHPKAGRTVGPLVCIPCQAGNHARCLEGLCRCDHLTRPGEEGS